METRTITIKSFEKTSGKKQDQTEWHRISIKATDGKFYSSFKPIAEAALAPGAQLQLQVEQSKIKAIVKEAIEEERKNRYKIYLRTFLVALGGVLFFFWGLSGVILLITLFGLNNFIAGLFIGVIIGVDMWLIAYLVKQVK